MRVSEALNASHNRCRANNIIFRLDRKDSEVSPGTIPSRSQPSNSRANIAPWDDGPTSSGQNNSHSGSIPSIHRQPPSGSPWSGSDANASQMPTSVFGGTFYNDSTENLGQVSPGYAPQNGMSYPNDGDDRRPSIASATTVDSSDSKPSMSGRVHRKLQGFFGEDYKGLEEASRQPSETSSMQGNRPSFAQSGGEAGERSNSVNDASQRSGPPSPSSSRPRTPAQGPASEVTPWVFQDSSVSGMKARPGRHFQAKTNACCRTNPLPPTRHFLNKTTEGDPRTAQNIRIGCTYLVTDTTAVMRRDKV